VKEDLSPLLFSPLSPKGQKSRRPGMIHGYSSSYNRTKGVWISGLGWYGRKEGTGGHRRACKATRNVSSTGVHI